MDLPLGKIRSPSEMKKVEMENLLLAPLLLALTSCGYTSFSEARATRK